MRIRVKHFLMVAVLGVVLAGAFMVVNINKTEASSGRDCDKNSIDYMPNHGGCGAMSASELIADINTNQPSDLKTVYNYFGLTADKYDRFAKTAKNATVYRDGRVVVDGQTVMTNAHSYGREKFNSYRQPVKIGNTTYYHSATQYSFAASTNSLPGMVMFDGKGAPEVVIINACGNPVTGTKVTPSYACKALNMKSLGNDTYSFTSTVSYSGNAKFEKVVYDFGDGSAPVTKTNTGEAVSHKFTKSATVKVTAHFVLPGGQKVAVTSSECAKKVTVTPPPFYACVVLTPRAMNEQKTRFRFTVKTSQGNGATLKDADFALDGKVTNRGVTTKDENNNIYQEYSFTDTVQHTIVATVNFNVAGGVKSVTCQAKVTPEQQPICTVPGKEHLNLPPDSPECKEDVCTVPGKENLPANSPECKEDTPPAPSELPNTGVEGILGTFAATTVGGAVAHRLVWSRRSRRQ